MCRFIVRVWEFVGLLDHNDWIFFVVLDSCCQMGQLKIEAETLYDLRVDVIQAMSLKAPNNELYKVTKY